MGKVCCFIGHRKIVKTPELTAELIKRVEQLITNKNVATFLFGCNSEFDDLCYETVSELKEKYPNIRRVYVRAKYPHISEHYKSGLLEQFEDTYFPQSVFNAGKASYVKRNQEMINKSDICIFYYDENYELPQRKASQCDVNYYKPSSGTRIAYSYAVKKKKEIINISAD